MSSGWPEWRAISMRAAQVTCAFPASTPLPPAAVPVTWFGIDTRELLTRSLDLLQAQREGRKVAMQSFLKAKRVTAGELRGDRGMSRRRSAQREVFA